MKFVKDQSSPKKNIGYASGFACNTIHYQLVLVVHL